MKKTNVKKILLVISLSVVALCIIAFLVAMKYFSSHWYPNTVINGINFSGKSFDASKEILEKELARYTLTITGRNGSTDKIEGKAIDLSANVSAPLKDLYDEQHNTFFLFKLFHKWEDSIDCDADYDDTALRTLLKKSPLVIGSANNPIIQPKSASISYSQNAQMGVIQQDVKGNVLDEEYLIKYVSKAVSHLQDKLDLTIVSECPNVYIRPEHEAESEIVQDTLLAYNNYLLHWITWDMGENVSESITPAEINKWLSVNDKWEVVLDENAVADWIEAFCLKYKTTGVTRTFTTHTGAVIDIEGGDYGWRIDYDKTLEQALNIIKSKPDKTAVENYLAEQTEENKKALIVPAEVLYSTTGFKHDYVNFKDDWDTKNYSEVDLTEQKVYVYKDGQLAYNCICVSGLPVEGRFTETGCWYIKDRKEDYVLRGDDYVTPTKYWVRITWMGIGFHYLARKDWAAWSPTLYQTAGSHGCLNLQMEDAKAVYDLVRLNDPVFIHY